jgi:hypothetical protein
VVVELDPPKFIGRSSRYWQIQTPSEVIIPALAIWRVHQSQFVGRECEYKEVTRRWMKWRVRAKSGTSFEREIKRRREITLQCKNPCQ